MKTNRKWVSRLISSFGIRSYEFLLTVYSIEAFASRGGIEYLEVIEV